MLTPYLIYIKVFLAGLMAAGLIGCGFYWGNKSGAEARRVLAEYKQKSEASQKLQNQTIAELKTSNEGLSAILAVSLANTEAKVAKVRQEWAAADLKRASTIKELQGQVSAKSIALISLEAKIAATTDPVVKTALENLAIAQRESLTNVETQVQGLECLTVPIPDDYIERLNSYENPTTEISYAPPAAEEPAREPKAGRLDR